MRVRVLGSAAGGGFPQWNCGCYNCRGVRQGTLQASPRTQESLAFSADGESWFLLNASPEIRGQIESFAPLHPRGPRDCPIAGILLTNGDLDHCLGLLSLRESQRLSVYATERVRAGFVEGNALYATLQRFPGQVTWTGLAPGVARELSLPDGKPSGLTLRPIAVPGQPPLHLRFKFSEPHPEDNVGFIIQAAAGGATFAYVPGCARVTPELADAVSGADCLFFDGTFWSSDELIALGLGTRRAEDMAHLPIGGSGGSLAAFAARPRGQRFFIHINNTNPILREDSRERGEVQAAGWQVAHDGLELTL